MKCLLSSCRDVIFVFITLTPLIDSIVENQLLMHAVVWTVISEVMPNRLRMKAVSLFLSLNWACNLFISALTLTAIDELGGVKESMDDDQTAQAEKNGVAYLYFIFAAITFLTLVFTHMCVPETKGKTDRKRSILFY